jgi:AraC-like DNA-binding protein
MSHSVQPLFDTTLLDVRLHSAVSSGGVWSEPYVVSSARCVIPQCGAVSFTQAQGQWVGTPLNLLRLDASAPYRMRPFGADRVSSVVMVPKTTALRTGSQPIALREMLRLRTMVQTNGVGRDAALALEEWFATNVDECAQMTTMRGLRPSAKRAVIVAQEFVCEHFAQPLRLADIAQAASASPFHLARSFKRATGLSLHQTQMALRIAAAVTRIEQGERNFTTLALDMGFSSHAHFTSVFRRALGRTPSAYRNASATFLRSATAH